MFDIFSKPALTLDEALDGIPWCPEVQVQWHEDESIAPYLLPTIAQRGRVLHGWYHQQHLHYETANFVCYQGISPVHVALHPNVTLQAVRPRSTDIEIPLLQSGVQEFQGDRTYHFMTVRGLDDTRPLAMVNRSNAGYQLTFMVSEQQPARGYIQQSHRLPVHPVILNIHSQDKQYQHVENFWQSLEQGTYQFPDEANVADKIITFKRS